MRDESLLSSSFYKSKPTHDLFSKAKINVKLFENVAFRKIVKSSFEDEFSFLPNNSMKSNL